MANPLDAPLGRYLPRAATTALRTNADIATVGELLYTLPRSWRTLDVRADLDPHAVGDTIGVIGTVTRARMVQMRKTRTLKNGRTVAQKMLKLTVQVGRDHLDVAFFNVFDYFQATFPPGQEVFLSGKLGLFGRSFQLQHPYFITINPDGTAGVAGGALKGLMKAVAATAAHASEDPAAPATNPGGLASLDAIIALIANPNLPHYRGVKKLSTWDFLIAHASVAATLEPVPDPLPEVYRRRHQLLDLDSALRRVHHPGAAGPQAGLDRLAFDEALAVALVQATRRAERVSIPAPEMPPVAGGLLDRWRPTLPFTLTSGQHRVVAEITADMARPIPMQRLLQGDVGSGKTVIALSAALYAIDAGYQVVLLAPTEVLARQHAATLTQLLGELAGRGTLGSDPDSISVQLLTGSLSAPERERALLDIMTGDATLIVGTHAVLTDGLHYDNLGLVIIDEQHRFGVKQRAALAASRRDGRTPHVLSLTATPIPRTLAQTAYGDVDVSSLHTVPAGRSPVESFAFSTGQRTWVTRLWEVVAQRTAAGGQTFIVCPRIDVDSAATPADLDQAARLLTGEPLTTPPHPETDHRVLTSAIWLTELLTTTVLREQRVGLVHGGLSSEEITTRMNAFRAGELDVLIATTVIEVGVDIPNADVMIICDADRFGVAQLHQLRGRVGRGSRPAQCFFLTSPLATEQALDKLTTIAATASGFALAELDLQWRREGDILGVAQSGPLTAVQLFDITVHGELIEHTRAIAAELIEELGVAGVKASPVWAHARRLLLRGGYDIDHPETTG